MNQCSIRGFLLTSIAVFTSWCWGQQAATPHGQAVLLAISKPTFPQMARIANVEGTVVLSVIIQQDGTSEATFVSGPLLLKQAALDSAAQSRFECRLCTAPHPYTLVYDFKRTSKGSCCDGFGAPTQVEQQAPSSDERGQPQTQITVATERTCICDPIGTVTKRVRSPKCFYPWKCSIRE